MMKPCSLYYDALEVTFVNITLRFKHFHAYLTLNFLLLCLSRLRFLAQFLLFNFLLLGSSVVLDWPQTKGFFSRKNHHPAKLLLITAFWNNQRLKRQRKFLIHHMQFNSGLYFSMPVLMDNEWKTIGTLLFIAYSVDISIYYIVFVQVTFHKFLRSV